MQFSRSLRRRVKRLRPYPALLLVFVPLAVVEPLKLLVVFVAGEGHWVTGIVGMIFAYAVSLFVVHWLFKVVKPTLLRLPWFAGLWPRLVRLAMSARALLPSRWSSSSGGRERRRTVR
jgi:hypothetical protein